MNERSKKRNYYPVFLNLEGRLVVVAGGGKVAERKVQGLLNAKAKIRLISPKVTQRLEQMAQGGLIELRMRGFSAEDMNGAWLAIAATDDREIQDAVYRAAEERGVFCNMVNQPGLCSFIVPSVVRRGDFCLAISTSGKSPALAKRFKEDIERSLGDRFGEYVALIGDLRDHILDLNQDSCAKTDMCQSLADKNVMEWFERNEFDKISAWAASKYGQWAVEIVERYRRSTVPV
ncbi:MAG: precorrin-2 dehydrogenase/sirohydrochlorin ferrochelatase family protein [Dissulfurimicrobium sp.]|uniref:precorrin-2 dehydrogenase/sirohydrochlorin ferrochelatase family protein n=1 Tax=Dissulfurimicrobium sp. TaxID=2022436 RepID=UPI00404B22B1